MSRLTAGASLPFSNGSLRGVGLVAEDSLTAAGKPSAASRPSIAAELTRVVARDGRIAVWGAAGPTAGPAVREWEDALKAEGLDVLASEETAVVVRQVAR